MECPEVQLTFQRASRVVRLSVKTEQYPRHSLTPETFASRGERAMWEPVKFWNETLTFWGKFVTSLGLQLIVKK